MFWSYIETFKDRLYMKSSMSKRNQGNANNTTNNCILIPNNKVQLMPPSDVSG